jgi:hypothetical protein
VESQVNARFGGANSSAAEPAEAAHLGIDDHLDEGGGDGGIEGVAAAG